MRVGGVAPVSVSFSLFRTVFRRFVVVTVLPFLLLFPFPLPQPLPGEVHYIHQYMRTVYMCVCIYMVQLSRYEIICTTLWSAQWDAVMRCQLSRNYFFRFAVGKVSR